MDAKITLSFDADVIEKAKAYADSQGISLSRLMEVLLRRVTYNGGYRNIEDVPIANWVQTVSEGEAEYITPRKRKNMKEEYYNSKK